MAENGAAGMSAELEERLRSKRLVETVEALNAMAACSESEFRSRGNLAPEWLILKPETNMRDIVVGAGAGGVYVPPYKREVSQPRYNTLLEDATNPDFHSPLAPLSVQDLVNRHAKLTGGVKHVKGYFSDRALVSV